MAERFIPPRMKQGYKFIPPRIMEENNSTEIVYLTDISDPEKRFEAECAGLNINEQSKKLLNRKIGDESNRKLVLLKKCVAEINYTSAAITKLRVILQFNDFYNFTTTTMFCRVNWESTSIGYGYRFFLLLRNGTYRTVDITLKDEGRDVLEIFTDLSVSLFSKQDKKRLILAPDSCIAHISSSGNMDKVGAEIINNFIQRIEQENECQSNQEENAEWRIIHPENPENVNENGLENFDLKETCDIVYSNIISTCLDNMEGSGIVPQVLQIVQAPQPFEIDIAIKRDIFHDKLICLFRKTLISTKNFESLLEKIGIINGNIFRNSYEDRGVFQWNIAMLELRFNEKKDNNKKTASDIEFIDSFYNDTYDSFYKSIDITINNIRNVYAINILKEFKREFLVLKADYDKMERQIDTNSMDNNSRSNSR